ncbi:UDP-N-acetylglucosamine 2-epimerase (non-hydrolyzing) [Granulosicoccus sp.]|nr:UDP-N-acetylglucosamine 2-epimerase (non-hydrolyzing) [Granulosicoccus sp.]
MKPLKVVTILGTRPEIIRLSRVMAMLERYCNHVLVHTGQNYDYELNEVFFSDLGVRQPNHFLGVDTSSLGATVGGILIESEKLLAKEKPDAVLILGDTNSAIAAYIARRMKIPVYHMEAGNRCFDRNVPEETNRKMVDHLSDFNLVYSEHARRNLIAEGLPARRIYITGSPMREVLECYRDEIEGSSILSDLKLEAGSYFLVSIHREENVDNSSNLTELINALNQLAKLYDCPVIVSTHPRTRKRLDALGDVPKDKRIAWLKPFGFHDYNKLQMSAKCVLSDSGTIAEESSILGFAAITPRFSIERPEALDTGAIVACGYSASNIIRAVQTVILQHTGKGITGSSSFVPNDYCITNTSQRVVNLIVGTAKLSNQWDGIRENPSY